MTYAEKLKDPRWQKKRLEILQRDNFKCRDCNDAKSTLHVHHREYIKGRDPWDYGDSFLVTLCEKCHELSHANDEDRHDREMEDFKKHLLELVATAFDRSRTEKEFLPYGTFTDAIADLSVLQTFYPNENMTEQEKLRQIIAYLTARLDRADFS